MSSSKQQAVKKKASESVPRSPVISLTIKSNGKVVAAGSKVLVQCSKSNRGERVALIHSIQDDGGKLKVTVFWYYWAHETAVGNKPFFGDKEVFMTLDGDEVSADDVIDICYVRSLVEYVDLYHIYPQDYFCRFSYNIDNGLFHPSQVPVFCKCEMPINPDQFMLKCIACENRYHPSCLGMTEDEAMHIDSYVCCS